jgi:hypothetical protein
VCVCVVRELVCSRARVYVHMSLRAQEHTRCICMAIHSVTACACVVLLVVLLACLLFHPNKDRCHLFFDSKKRAFLYSPDSSVIHTRMMAHIPGLIYIPYTCMYTGKYTYVYGYVHSYVHCYVLCIWEHWKFTCHVFIHTILISHACTHTCLIACTHAFYSSHVHSLIPYARTVLNHMHTHTHTHTHTRTPVNCIHMVLFSCMRGMSLAWYTIRLF